MKVERLKILWDFSSGLVSIRGQGEKDIMLQRNESTLLNLLILSMGMFWTGMNLRTLLKNLALT